MIRSVYLRRQKRHPKENKLPNNQHQPKTWERKLEQAETNFMKDLISS